jgi:hypothetical protein
MATQSAQPVQSATAISATRPARSVTERWLFAAFLLSGAPQLITISALLSADPLAASWSALLLAIAPVLLAAAAAFGPRSVSRLAILAAAVVLVVGIVGSLASWSSAISHTGVLFIPALVAVIAGALRLWRTDAP